MATTTSFDEQVKNKEADWKGPIMERFCWLIMCREFGRWCYVVYPVEGVPDFSWWEWEDMNLNRWSWVNTLLGNILIGSFIVVFSVLFVLGVNYLFTR